MSQFEVERKNYQMPPQDGFTIAHFLTVLDIERSARFYERVFGGRILSGGDSSGAPGYIQIANTWLIVNVGGDPTPDKPSVTLSVPADPDFSQQLYEYPSCRYSSLLRTLAKSRSRVYYRAKGQVRRDPLLHSRSRWLYYRSWAKQAGRRLRLKGTTVGAARARPRSFLLDGGFGFSAVSPVSLLKRATHVRW